MRNDTVDLSSNYWQHHTVLEMPSIPATGTTSKTSTATTMNKKAGV